MRTYLALFIVGLLLACDPYDQWATVAAADGSDPSDSLAARLPANIIIVDKLLSDVVVDMLRGSPTFRDQCRQLAQVRALRVRVSLDPDRPTVAQPDCRALCVIKRYQFGFVDAHVRLRTVADPQTLIAHEFEHVREYVEGLNYLGTSVQFPSRVWITMAGHYETARAIEAGNQVASEMIRQRTKDSTATLARRAQ